MTLVQPRNFHRLALAVNDVPETAAWLVKMFGALPMGGADAAVSEGLPGTMTKLQWVGGYPVILLGGGLVSRFLERQGPGVQSWAWEVDDNWAVEHLVRDRGIDVISVNIQGRFFFMHPSQTYGLLMEWCDGKMPRDPRATEVGHGIVDVKEIGWITGVVADADATAEWLSGLAETTVVETNAKGPEHLERTIDLKVGDITARLVTPLSPESRYAAFLEKGPRVHSFTIRVPDLDEALAKLAAEGLPTVYREGALASTDPATTLGLRIDWTE
ncbi:MAG TPA: hypothetical protein VGH94_15340 [Acidimicrobiales bacterium]|jgi:hypothetical protein